jgi:hypothetical protein
MFRKVQYRVLFKGVMSLKENIRRICFSKQLNYLRSTNLKEFFSTEHSFKLVPLNISRCLHIGDCLSVYLSVLTIFCYETSYCSVYPEIPRVFIYLHGYLLA